LSEAKSSFTYEPIIKRNVIILFENWKIGNFLKIENCLLKILSPSGRKVLAGMAELADAHGSGPCE